MHRNVSTHSWLREREERKDWMQLWGTGWSSGGEPECFVDCSSIYQDFPGVSVQSLLLNLTALGEEIWLPGSLGLASLSWAAGPRPYT